ncbi:phosphate-import protein PhnD precursor [bacterium BMS3Abin13]|nr:phosphate-import protein PhnD precursor [bacterium BMS3Abin13]
MHYCRNTINILLAYLLIISLANGAQARTLSSPPPTKPFYFAVSAMTSPARTLAHFSELTTYLAAKLNRPVHLKQRRTYAEINDLLAQSRIQMAFTCTGGYIAGRRDFGLNILVVPVIKGNTFYRSYIVVRQKSSFKSLADLKGRVFAYADPLSLSGYIYPAARIRQLGYSAKKFFRHVFFTESHDKSIEAVATGIADGAAVDSLIFNALRAQAEPNAKRLKVIERSEKFGMPPVVVGPNIDHDFRYRLLKVMLNMSKNAAGRAVLKRLGMDRFVLPDHALYHSAFLLNKELE